MQLNRKYFGGLALAAVALGRTRFRQTQNREHKYAAIRANRGRSLHIFQRRLP